MNLNLPSVLVAIFLAPITWITCFGFPLAANGQDDFPRPQSGELAPDFQLKLLDGSEDRSLHKATRPTVLFFGSYS